MNNQMLISYNQSEQKDLTSILNELPRLSKLYDVRLLSETSRKFVLHVQTKDKNECGDVQLTFQKRSLDIRHVLSKCEETGTVSISLSNLKRNRIRDLSRFAFTPPADAEIISDATFP